MGSLSLSLSFPPSLSLSPNEALLLFRPDLRGEKTTTRVFSSSGNRDLFRVFFIYIFLAHSPPSWGEKSDHAARYFFFAVLRIVPRRSVK